MNRWVDVPNELLHKFEKNTPNDNSDIQVKPKRVRGNTKRTSNK
jgi:hypothetical protein